MQQRPVGEETIFKLRWLIIYPLIAILILTISLMVKEYKDQKVRSDNDFYSYVIPSEVDMENFSCINYFAIMQNRKGHR